MMWPLFAPPTRAGTKALDDETLREVIDREHAKHRELIAVDLPVPSGIVSFIKAAARHYDLGIVSMAVRSEIDHVLNLAGLTNQFSLIVSAEPGLRHKPAPDCYERALEVAERAPPPPAGFAAAGRQECLVIEDAPPGIASARAAGMRTVGVTTTVTEQALRTAGAEIVTPNLADWSPDSVHHLFD
jgi:HAD superfamily hydrolase (TIGR01509 family)